MTLEHEDTPIACERCEDKDARIQHAQDHAKILQKLFADMVSLVTRADKAQAERIRALEAEAKRYREALGLVAHGSKSALLDWCIKHHCHIGARLEDTQGLRMRVATAALEHADGGGC